MSPLGKILESRYPIIQGPIGELNDPSMVAAVSEAGGFGMLALGFIHDPQKVKQMVAQVKDLTDKPFGANLMIAMNPNNEAILEILAEMGGQDRDNVSRIAEKAVSKNQRTGHERPACRLGSTSGAESN